MTAQPAHLAPDACYVCGHGEHEDTTPAGGHRYWSNRDAAREFREADTGRVARSPEAAYVEEYRPY